MESSSSGPGSHSVDTRVLVAVTNKVWSCELCSVRCEMCRVSCVV